jgi:hypothetical protein
VKPGEQNRIGRENRANIGHPKMKGQVLKPPLNFQRNWYDHPMAQRNWARGIDPLPFFRLIHRIESQVSSESPVVAGNKFFQLLVEISTFIHEPRPFQLNVNRIDSVSMGRMGRDLRSDMFKWWWRLSSKGSG